MNTSDTARTPRTLHTDRALSKELLTCPTCLSYGGRLLPGDPPVEELQVCPTCGVASVEWTLACSIDELAALLTGLSRLEEHLRAEELPPDLVA